MEVKEALENRRTIRKFLQKPVDKNILTELIGYARLMAYAANLQPLKFAPITDPETVKKIFPLTKWAAYLPDENPAENERPPAYIAVFGDKTVKKEFETDAGAAIAAMMIGAYDKGLGSCWLGAIKREELSKLFGIDTGRLSLLYLLALGYPAEKSRAVEMKEDVKYFRSDDGVFNVPKRSIEEITIYIKGEK